MNVYGVALLAEGVDRNQIAVDFGLLVNESPSSRRAWIEILASFNKIHKTKVALLAEGVDRNSPINRLKWSQRIVALLAEGVDRNQEHQEKLWQQG